MPKDAAKNIDRYKIDGGQLNEFEYQQNQEDLAKQEEQDRLNLIPGTPPEQQVPQVIERAEKQFQERRKNAVAKKAVSKKSAGKKASTKKVSKKPAAKKKPSTKTAAKQTIKSTATKNTAKKLAARKAGKKKPATKK